MLGQTGMKNSKFGFISEFVHCSFQFEFHLWLTEHSSDPKRELAEDFTFDLASIQ